MNPNQPEILLIEDESIDIMLAQNAFKKNYIADRLQVVKDGAEALDFLFCRGDYAARPKSQNPRLILLDLGLPMVSGLEVLRRIREEPRTRNIPVVVLTGSEAEHDIMESYRLGISSYIVKPVNFEQLAAAVQQKDFSWRMLTKAAPSALASG